MLGACTFICESFWGKLKNTWGFCFIKSRAYGTVISVVKTPLGKPYLLLKLDLGLLLPSRDSNTSYLREYFSFIFRWPYRMNVFPNEASIYFCIFCLFEIIRLVSSSNILFVNFKHSIHSS